MFTIFIPITQQSAHNRLAENQPTAGLGSLNKYEKGLGKSETELNSKRSKYQNAQSTTNFLYKVVNQSFYNVLSINGIGFGLAELHLGQMPIIQSSESS